MASFEETIRSGADGFETDLRLLSDRTAILFHDDELDELEVETLSSAAMMEHGGTIQRLDAIADLAQRTRMVLEVKRGRWEDDLLEIVAEWPNIIIASFDHSVIEAIHRRRPDLELGVTVQGFIVGLPEYCVGLGARWCFPNHRHVDEDLVRALHARQVKVIPWTANREIDWVRLRLAGCDGLITDLPAEAVAWRNGSLGA